MDPYPLDQESLPTSLRSSVNQLYFILLLCQVFIKDAEGPVSPFHDIPLMADEENKTFNVVIEVRVDQRSVGDLDSTSEKKADPDRTLETDEDANRFFIKFEKDSL